MQVYPAMDLIGGQCVRLHQGDFSQKTVYEHSPIVVAKQYQQAGADWLHIVDLDGAKDPENRQLALLSALIEQTDLSVQVGGGVRTAEQVVQLLDLGVSRVMIGSLAVTNQQLVADWLQRFGGQRILLTLDAQVDSSGEPMATTAGWQKTADISVKELMTYYRRYGLCQVLCTDIACDGTLSGPNVELYGALISQFPDIEMIASGGVARLSDLHRLQQLGVAGIVVGKALYEGRFSLQEALLCR